MILLSIGIYFDPVFLSCLYENVVVLSLSVLELGDALAELMHVGSRPPPVKRIANCKAEDKECDVVKYHLHVVSCLSSSRAACDLSTT